MLIGSVEDEFNVPIALSAFRDTRLIGRYWLLEVMHAHCIAVIAQPGAARGMGQCVVRQCSEMHAGHSTTQHGDVNRQRRRKHTPPTV